MASIESSVERQATDNAARTATDATSSDKRDGGTRTTSRRESTSTVSTSATTLGLITATPSHGTPTGIEWGPAITASSLPASEAAAQPTPSSRSDPGLSHDAKTSVIATTTIGGTLILAFLIYALWRRRRGATFSEIMHFRPRSSTPICSPGPRNAHFTALPIYRESRYSVRSSKRGSWLSFGKFRQKREDCDSPTPGTFPKGSALHAHWKSTHPPTPTRSGHPLSQVELAPPTSVQPPEMTHTRSTSPTEKVRIKRATHEDDNPKSLSKVSTREVPSSSEGPISKPSPGSPNSDKEAEDDTRWSWTNSQAPPTPRIRTRSPTRRFSKRSSTSSFRSLRKVHSWIKPQSDHIADRIPEEQATRPATKPKLPPLKNKASRPVLAPVNAKSSRQPGTARPTPTTPTRSEGAEESAPDTPGISLPLQKN